MLAYRTCGRQVFQVGFHHFPKSIPSDAQAKSVLSIQRNRNLSRSTDLSKASIQLQGLA